MAPLPRRVHFVVGTSLLSASLALGCTAKSEPKEEEKRILDEAKPDPEPEKTLEPKPEPKNIDPGPPEPIHVNEGPKPPPEPEPVKRVNSGPTDAQKPLQPTDI